jgi:hypothetical protein
MNYTVEYGNENNNGFDICATGNDKVLIGEAFNVVPSFFQTKKASMLKKLATSSADFKIIMFNHDAVVRSYRPKPNITMNIFCSFRLARTIRIWFLRAHEYTTKGVDHLVCLCHQLLLAARRITICW